VSNVKYIFHLATPSKKHITDPVAGSELCGEKLPGKINTTLKNGIMLLMAFFIGQLNFFFCNSQALSGKLNFHICT